MSSTPPPPAAPPSAVPEPSVALDQIASDPSPFDKVMSQAKPVRSDTKVDPPLLTFRLTVFYPSGLSTSKRPSKQSSRTPTSSQPKPNRSCTRSKAMLPHTRLPRLATPPSPNPAQTELRVNLTLISLSPPKRQSPYQPRHLSRLGECRTDRYSSKSKREEEKKTKNERHQS